MHTATAEDDAKENCVATIIRIIDIFGSHFSEADYNTLFDQVMQALPFRADSGENETALKFIMNLLNTERRAKAEEHMGKVSLICLKILTDHSDLCDIDDAFKVLTARFIKNVIMESGEQSIALLQ
jgi:hypothetical protein